MSKDTGLRQQLAGWECYYGLGDWVRHHLLANTGSTTTWHRDWMKTQPAEGGSSVDQQLRRQDYNGLLYSNLA